VYVNCTSFNYGFYELILSPSSCFSKSFALVCICQSIVFLAVQQLVPGQLLGFNLHFPHKLLRWLVRPHLCLVGVHLQNAKGLVESGPLLTEYHSDCTLTVPCFDETVPILMKWYPVWWNGIFQWIGTLFWLNSNQF